MYTLFIEDGLCGMLNYMAKNNLFFKHAHDFTVEDACIFQITATYKNKTSEIPFKLNKITVLAFK